MNLETPLPAQRCDCFAFRAFDAARVKTFGETNPSGAKGVLAKRT